MFKKRSTTTSSQKPAAHFVTRLWAVLLLVTLMLGLQPIPAAAQGTSYTVTRFDDPDPPGPCFVSDCSLREAVIAANSNAGADLIFLPAGDYFLSAGSPGDDIAVGGDLDITDDLTIVGAGPEITFISMSSLNDRAFHIPSSGSGSASTAVTIESLSIYNGQPGSGDGGGILNQGLLSLQDVEIYFSVAESGGGLFNEEGAQLSFHTGRLQFNKATHPSDGGGGGITNWGEAWLTDVAIVDNSAVHLGGGVLNAVGTSPPTPPSLELINVTISNNSAGEGGGGIYNFSALDLLHTTVAQNEVTTGSHAGGLYDQALAQVTLQNSLLAENDNGNCEITGSGLTTLRGHNLSDDTTCPLTGPSDFTNTPARLGSLQENGGSTLTHGLISHPDSLLFPPSLAINTADSSICRSNDQRGVRRPEDRCDMGAYEHIPTPALPACFQPTTTIEIFTPAGGMAIPDDNISGITPSINVSGVDSYLWDLNVGTHIDHPRTEDIDMILYPPGTGLTKLTTDNGGNNENVFQALTVWDDQALGPVTDITFEDFRTASPLAPEEALANFRGIDPNGQWTLGISDDQSGEAGSLVNWALELTTLPQVPRTRTLSFAQSATVPFSSTDKLLVGLDVPTTSGVLADVNLTTHIQQDEARELDVYLTSPANTRVSITTGNGGINANVFDGTVWDDQFVAGLQTGPEDYSYTDGVAAPYLMPEGALAAFNGENPTGRWTLTIIDHSGLGGPGSLNGWSLTIKVISCDTYLPAIMKNN